MIGVLLGIVGDVVRYVVPRRTPSWDNKNLYMRDSRDGYWIGESNA